MEVVILDDWEGSFAESPSIKQLEQHFNVTIYCDKPTKEELINRLQLADVVIPIRERTKFTSELLEELKNIKLIAQTGCGVAHIDMEKANRLNIPIATTRGGSASVVELIFSYILSYSKKLLILDSEMKKGIWSDVIGFGLERKTIGIIGLGKIGTNIATIAKAFGMNVVAWGPRLTKERADRQGITYRSLEELLRCSHFVTVNVRLVPETTNLLSKNHFDMMRSDSFFINTSRAKVVDSEALYQALKNKKISGAGLDVFNYEPINVNDSLLQLDNVILTPHIGWKTDNIFSQFIEEATTNIISLLIDKEPRKVINLDNISLK